VEYVLDRIHRPTYTDENNDPFSAKAIEEGIRWEESQAPSPYGAVIYQYGEFTEAPKHHIHVAVLFFKGKTVEEIAVLTRLTPATVRKILKHEPVARWVETMRMRLEDLMHDAAKEKFDIATATIPVLKGIVTGEVKASKTRLDAIIYAQALDPPGRFQKFTERDAQRKPVSTADLHETVEAGRKFVENQAKALAQNKDTEDESGFETAAAADPA